MWPQIGLADRELCQSSSETLQLTHDGKNHVSGGVMKKWWSGMLFLKSQMLEASGSTLIFFLLPCFFFFFLFNVYLGYSLLWRKSGKCDPKIL